MILKARALHKHFVSEALIRRLFDQKKQLWETLTDNTTSSRLTASSWSIPLRNWTLWWWPQICYINSVENTETGEIIYKILVSSRSSIGHWGRDDKKDFHIMNDKFGNPKSSISTIETKSVTSRNVLAACPLKMKDKGSVVRVPVWIHYSRNVWKGYPTIELCHW